MPFGLSFATPAVLAGLVLLPALFFLLRVTPPAPRRQLFPALRLLRGLAPIERTPMRMPLWLLLLRLLASGLVIIGFAGPQILPSRLLPGNGPVLLAIDNSWAAAPDWATRMDAARTVVAMAGARGVVLLPTAPDEAGAPPRATGVLTPRTADSLLAAWHPEPWPAPRLADAAAARAARAATSNLTAVYISDGLSDGLNDGLGDQRFLAALDPARVAGPGAESVRLALPPGRTADGHLVAKVAVVAQPRAVTVPVLAEAADGAVLARSLITVPAGKAKGGVKIDLPLELQNRLARLRIPGAGAGGVVLLDGGDRLALAGMVAGGQGDAEEKFLGALYYLRRALPTGSRIATGPIPDLIRRGVGVLFLADAPLAPVEVEALRGWMNKGGVLIRFAGPLTAAHRDDLAPDPLLGGDRSLGGALSWTQQEPVAAFAADSPLAGLQPPRRARVARQLLADPQHLIPDTVWARLADGTPLVLGARQGQGVLVYVLTTANAAWSDWPLAPGFPAFIARLVDLSRHQAKPQGMLNPVKVLTGEGDLAAPGPAARALPAAQRARLVVSPAHPPGLWGQADAPVAINLGGHVPPLAAAPLPPGAAASGLNVAPRPRYFGPALLAMALALLLADMVIGLLLRGLLRAAVLGLAAIIVLSQQAQAAVPKAALSTSLAYVRGDPASDQITQDGLSVLSALVDQETAARLAAPAGVVPGQDNLLLYPMLYWRITSGTALPDAAACRALSGFMASGGLLVVDTDGSDAGAPGSGAGLDPGAVARVKQALACLPIPPLRALTPRDTLAHTFYLLPDFPGRFTGAPVYIAAKGGQDADGVSPVVIGTNDWAAAWAISAEGAPLQALLPATPDETGAAADIQRRDATWFGVNLVMYALTGTYKSDQLQIPAILRRMSQ